MKQSERGDIETVTIAVVIVLLVIVFTVYIVAFIYAHDMCRIYDDTPISEVPAKCINWRGGTY